jgi:hypothetical protein
MNVFIQRFKMPQLHFWSKTIGELKDLFYFKKFNKKMHNVVWVQYKSSQKFSIVNGLYLQ